MYRNMTIEVISTLHTSVISSREHIMLRKFKKEINYEQSSTIFDFVCQREQVITKIHVWFAFCDMIGSVLAPENMSFSNLSHNNETIKQKQNWYFRFFQSVPYNFRLTIWINNENETKLWRTKKKNILNSNS